MYQYASKGKTQSEGLKSGASTANKNHAQTGIKAPVQLMQKRPSTPLQMQLIPKQENGEARPIPMMLSEEQARLAPRSAQSNNTGIPLQMKEKFENLSGFSFDDVKVHYNSDKPAQLQALAYTQGNQVYVAPGQEKHLGHELGHVVQQKRGVVRPNTNIGGVYVNNQEKWEHEADRIGGSEELLSPANTLSKVSMQAEVLQGKFGFEIETGIRVTAAKKVTPNRKRDITTDNTSAETDFEFDDEDDKWNKAEKVLSNYPVLGQSAAFELHVDHRPAAGGFYSIIEFVTNPPFDESSMTRDRVVSDMQQMANIAKDMATRSSSAPVDLSNFVQTQPRADWTLYAGKPGAGKQSSMGYVQCTFGVKLAGIPTAFSDIAKPNMSDTLQDSRNLTFAVNTATTLGQTMQKHLNENKPGYHPADYNIQEFIGFLTLLIHYLYSCSHRVYDKGLLKNQLSQIFYKTALHTVRNSLVGDSKLVVESDGWREWIQGHLQSNLKLDLAAKLLTGPEGSPTVCEYINRVLKGESDWIFTYFKNSYSQEITDTVGPADAKRPAMVMENRRIQYDQETIGEDAVKRSVRLHAAKIPTAELKHYQADEWAKLAGKYHDILTAWNIGG